MRVAFIAPLVVAAGLATPINAAVLLQVKEYTNDGVHVTARGSLDLTGLGTPTVQGLDRQTENLMNPSKGYISAGITVFADVYRDVFTNPVASFGNGGQADHVSYVTDGFFTVAMADNALMLPAGYNSNARIDTFTIYNGDPGFTLASLGLDAGSYDFSLVNGEHVKVEIAAVPLPATSLLLAGGLFALAAVGVGTRRSGGATA